MATQTRRMDKPAGIDGFAGFEGLDGFAVESRMEAANEDPDALRALLEERIAHWLDGSNAEADLLTAAMRAGTLSAGKRLRPLLLMLVARDLGCVSPALVDVACAVEMVHAASLILDDMPCMDNAMLRRGKPTIHVQFGEDVAILAAVALLSRAFGILSSSQEIPASVRARLVTRLSETIGTQGLVKGQFLDLHGGARSPEEIAATNELKTGVLLGVSVDMAAIIAQADDEVASALRAFAFAAGQAFQIRDDFQDGFGHDSSVTGKDVGKDIGKSTMIATLGVEEARRRLTAHLAEADRQLERALGKRQGTRRMVKKLFGTLGSASNSRPAPAPVSVTVAERAYARDPGLLPN